MKRIGQFFRSLFRSRVVADTEPDEHAQHRFI
jgi:hypothetical protein